MQRYAITVTLLPGLPGMARGQQSGVGEALAAGLSGLHPLRIP